MSEMEPSRMPKKRMPSTNTRIVTTVSGTVWGVMSPYPTVTTWAAVHCHVRVLPVMYSVCRASAASHTVQGHCRLSDQC